MKTLDPDRPHAQDPSREASLESQDAGTETGTGKVIPIPPQPAPAVQETSFAPDVTSELAVLEHEPIPEPGTSNSMSQPNSNYGATTNPPTAAENGGNNKPSPARSIPPDLLRGLLMILMALDHNVMTLRSWPHGTAINGETDNGIPSKQWNTHLAYTIRTLTHLCAPGFMFLLGMGIVYFGRSRTQLGWGASKMIWHFWVRGVVLTLLSMLLGFGLSKGRVWFLNIVLVALGVDYFLVGVGWVIMRWTEGVLARLVLRVMKRFGEAKKKGEEEPLLPSPLVEENGRLVHEEEAVVDSIAPDRSIIRAADISWHLHNVVLLALALVTIWWNIWLSPTGGGCSAQRDEVMPFGFEEPQGHGGWTPPGSIWFRFWFYPVQAPRFMSGFPPLGWISFAILGLLYGRIILARSWSAKAITAGNLLAGVAFILIFVGTRLLNVGNLSEGCLHMPEHSTSGNQYLTSPASFFYLIKYPPDVAFWAFTMGVNFLFLAIFSIVPPEFAAHAGKVLLVYGTSALFFYVVHIPLLGLIAEAVFIPWLGHEMDFEDVISGGEKAIGVDNLWGFFANWAVVLALLYPACRWYGSFKRGRGVDSIWRFF
ncbi:hypothetical protein V8F20_012108 [Naviculisporaceae sp. PSN 640]